MWNRLTCITPAQPVVALDVAKAHLRVDHDDQDALIADLVLDAQAVLEGPTGVGIAVGPSQWRLSLDAWACPIQIPLVPLTAVTEITYLDAAGLAQTLAPSAYAVDLDARPARISPAFGTSFPPARAQAGAIKITFQAGPATPDRNVLRAVLLLIAHWYENPGATGSKDLIDLPHGIRSILSRLQREA